MSYVLIVEDELQDNNHIKMNIEEGYDDYDFLFFSDGSGALKWLEESPSHIPDLIVTDLSMNPMRGTTMVEKIKKIDRLKYVPIVVMTFSTQPSDRLSMLRLGVNAYHYKGGTRKEKQKLLRGIFDYWLNLVPSLRD